jgi:uncharacterized protein (DUF608 family)
MKYISSLELPPTLKSFTGERLLQVAMPVGGIGAGNVCFNGSGGLQDFSIRNRPSTTAVQDGHSTRDAAFALLHIRGDMAVTKLIEGPIPPQKLYDQGLQAQGFRQGGFEGLPRFETCTFDAAYPFGTVRLQHKDIPLDVSVTAWNPFIPNDDLSSGAPTAILEYRFENNSDSVVDFEFSYHLSHFAGESANGHTSHWSKTTNRPIESGGILFSNTLPKGDESFGSAALFAVDWTPKIKAMWLRGGWFDGISALWREVSTGQFRENDGTQIVDDPNSRSGGSILGAAELQPGEQAVFPVLIAWHFPNSNTTVGCTAPPFTTGEACEPGCDCSHLISIDTDASVEEKSPAWRTFYSGAWSDAAAVAQFIASNYDSLRVRTIAFTSALLSSTLPSDVLDAVSSNLAILKSPTVLRQENGNIWGWEGCFADSGCCQGSCTHVWNYAQAMPHLFPRLERTLREQELLRSIDDIGHVNFRSALPEGPTDHGWHAAADGQLGGIVKLYRDWQISGDTEWMKSLYPTARRSLDYCIDTWDPDRRGGLFEPHHNTYDIEFWGADGMCGSIYVAALAAMSELSDACGEPDNAAKYRGLSNTAAEFMSKNLFNGEYYQQNVQWSGLKTTSFAESIASPNTADSEVKALLKSEGPKYQYGGGCLSDGIIGGWMALVSGLQTPLNRDEVRSTLSSIFRHNHKTDLFEHANLQRPGYAIGHEQGLLLCSWPRGGKPTLPFVYSDEVWTGIEYQVASHLIVEGYVDEGLTVVRSARSRYDGTVRNPFNEYECGSYYARAMSSYSLLASLSGFRYSAVERTLWLAPKLEIDKFQVFFSTEQGFGTIKLTGRTLLITIIEGSLKLHQVSLELGGVISTKIVDEVIRPGAPIEIVLA